MTSPNGNTCRVTVPLCGEFTGPGEFHTQRPVTRSFDAFFDLRLTKRLSKQTGGWWFETLTWSLWRHRNGLLRSSIKFQGHTGQKIANFYPNWAFLDCNRSLNSPMGLKWCTQLDVCSTEEVPYCFSRSSIKFEGHMDPKYRWFECNFKQNY